jgi:hypothetical protein
MRGKEGNMNSKKTFRPPRDDLLILRDLGLLPLFSKQQRKGMCYMERSDWFGVWKSFQSWYNQVVKDTGHSPTWRMQQNRIHKLVTKAIGYRRVQPMVTGKRPVGRPRKHPVAPVHGPGPVREFKAANTEPLPTLPPKDN